MKVSNIKDVLGEVKQLLNMRDKALLPAIHKLSNSLKDYLLQLKELNTQLKLGKTCEAMSQFGVQTLRWPFTSKKIEKLVASLENIRADLQFFSSSLLQFCGIGDEVGSCDWLSLALCNGSCKIKWVDRDLLGLGWSGYRSFIVQALLD